MSQFQNTKLLTLNKSTYDTSRVRFSKPILGSLQNQGGPTISFKRIMIGTVNEDGSKGELILETEEVFSFGVSENKDLSTGNLNGYVMPLCLHNRNGPTEAEENWVTVFNNIVEKCKEHLIKNRDEIEQYELETNDLKKLNPLYYKRDKGKIVEGTGPTLYCKLIVSKKQKNSILSIFGLVTDGDDDITDINPLELLGKYCYVKAAVKIESIFIGNKISLQVKLYEAQVRLLNHGPRRILRRPIPQRKLIVDDNEENEDDEENEESSNDDGSLKGSSESEEESSGPVPKIEPKRIVKRVVRKVIRKKT